MMGRQPDYQHKLFATGLNLDKRVRYDHPLRKITATIDLDFICHEVKSTYGVKGNVSVPPFGYLKDDAPFNPLQRQRYHSTAARPAVISNLRS